MFESFYFIMKRLNTISLLGLPRHLNSTFRTRLDNIVLLLGEFKLLGTGITLYFRPLIRIAVPVVEKVSAKQMM